MQSHQLWEPPPSSVGWTWLIPWLNTLVCAEPSQTGQLSPELLLWGVRNPHGPILTLREAHHFLCFLGVAMESAHLLHTAAFWASGTKPTKMWCLVGSQDGFTAWLVLAPPIRKEGSTWPCSETTSGLENSGCETPGIARTGRGRKQRKTVSVRAC